MKERSCFVSNSSSSSFIIKGYLAPEFEQMLESGQLPDGLSVPEFLSKVVCECPEGPRGSHQLQCNAWKMRFYK